MIAPAPFGLRPALVGPNTAIQLAAALEAMGEGAVAREAFAAAGRSSWLRHAPEAMIPEADAARLFAEVWRRLPPDRAAAVSEEAGRRVGAYIVAHRIPPVARRMLRLLPRPLAAMLLRRAIRAAAWTFAGSGRCTTGRGGRYGVIALDGNPLRLPGAPWHRAVFATLFAALVDPCATVIAECPDEGCAQCDRDACRFRIERG